MIDDLDTISSNIDEHTYLRLANGLQRLYNIHNSSIQSPNSVRETLNQRNQNRLRENLLDNNEVEITRILAQHYGRVYDSSGVLINSDDHNIIDNSNNNYNNYHSLNQALFRENARISYTALYNNAYDYWNQARYREFQENITTITSR
jgi:Zn-finger domain-containing protein